jgi:hypothetical protein
VLPTEAYIANMIATVEKLIPAEFLPEEYWM